MLKPGDGLNENHGLLGQVDRVAQRSNPLDLHMHYAISILNYAPKEVAHELLGSSADQGPSSYPEAVTELVEGRRPLKDSAFAMHPMFSI